LAVSSARITCTKPAWIVSVLDDDLRDLAERRRARVRYQQSVPAGGGWLFRSATADEMDGTVTRPREIRHTSDIFVAQDGLMYVTDYDAGLYILQWKGA